MRLLQVLDGVNRFHNQGFTFLTTSRLEGFVSKGFHGVL